MDPMDIHQAPPFKFLVVFNKLNKSLQVKLKDHFHEHGLTPTEFTVLDALYTHKRLPIQEIGSIVLITSGAITHVLRGLEKKGFVIREQAKSDRRMYYAMLTEKGIQFWEDFVPNHQGYIRKLFEPFDIDQLEQLTNLMKALGRYLDDLKE